MDRHEGAYDVAPVVTVDAGATEVLDCEVGAAETASHMEVVKRDDLDRIAIYRYARCGLACRVFLTISRRLCEGALGF